MGGCSSKESPSESPPPPRVVQQQNVGGGSVPAKSNAPAPLQAGRPPFNTSAPPREAPANSQPAGWPKEVFLLEMQVVVRVYTHRMPRAPQNPMPCWTYISQGLSAINQPEVVFTLLRRQNEQENDYPEAPIEWIRSVFTLAQNGIKLETGQICDLVFEGAQPQIRVGQAAITQDPNKWATFRRFGALVHGIAVSSSTFGIPDTARPASSHFVIALTHEEAAVARQFGPTRVIGHIGTSVRWFPHPPWVDRDRADCVTMADQAGSIRAGLPVARIYGFNVMLRDNEIVFAVPEGEPKRDNFRKYVQSTPLNAAMAFDGFMNEDADSGLCWKKGQGKAQGYAANTGQTKRLNLGFISFAGQQNSDKAVMVEDGYVLLIRDTTWTAIRTAIQNSRDLVVNLEGGMRFRLEWRKTAYHNPVDGASYHAEWKTYRPSGGVSAKPSSSHVQMGSIVLLIQPKLGDMDVDDFVQYEKEITKVLEDAIPVIPIPVPGSNEVGRQAILEIEIPKCEGWLKMVANPSMEGIPLQQILPRIAAIPQPKTLSRVKFQLIIDIWGYKDDLENFS